MWFAVGLSRRVSFLTWLTRAVAVATVLGLIVGPFAIRYLAARAGEPGDFALINRSLGIRQTLGHLLGLDGVLREVDGPSAVHLLLVLAALLIMAIRWRAGVSAVRRAYLGAWLFGIVAFAAALLVGNWMIRVPLPAFVLAAPLAALSWPERWVASRQTTALILLLGLAGLPALLFNQDRELVPLWCNRLLPLDRDRPSYLAQTRDEKLFANQPELLAPYRDAVEVVARSPASQIGLLLGGDSWEYPLWRILRDRSGDRPLRIEHVDLRSEPHWPLGPFVPDLLFWNQGKGDAPPMIELDGRQFTRVGPPGTIAVFARVGLALNRASARRRQTWP